jgi:hypothetical protein
MSLIIRIKTLPEDLLPIMCDHYGDERQLRALATVAQLNHRISNYARTRSYREIHFADDRSSRILENASELSSIYKNGDLLDTDILAAIDCKAIDSLDLDLPQRWLRSMRTCEIMVIKDILYGKDIDSLLSLATSLSGRDLVLFPKVKQITISAKIVKRILATEAKGPRPKQTPMDLLIVLFQATRPRRLCIQDSAIFTPPTRRHVTRIARQEDVGGRLAPSRGGHMSHTIILWIQGMAELEEIRYHDVKPDIPIYPKKGIRHVLWFIPDPEPPAEHSFSFGHHTYAIIRAIKDIIQRSVAGSPQFTTPPPRPLPSGAFSFGSASRSRGGAAAGPSAGGSLSGSTSTSASTGLGGFGLISGSGFASYLAPNDFYDPNRYGLFGPSSSFTGGLFGSLSLATSSVNGNGSSSSSSGNRPAFSFGNSASARNGTTSSSTSSDRPTFSFAASSSTTSVPAESAGGFGQSNRGFELGSSTTTVPVTTTSANPNGGLFGSTTTTAPINPPNPAGMNANNGSTTPTAPPPPHPTGNTLPQYNNLSAPATGATTRPNEDDPPMYKQSSWHFIIPGKKREMDRVKNDIMDWAEGFGCALGDGIREGITFGVREEEGKCGCCGY